MILGGFEHFQTVLEQIYTVSDRFETVTGGLEGRRALLPPLAALTQRAKPSPLERQTPKRSKTS